MRVLTLAKKEFKDILSEKIYIITLLLQIFVVVGIVFLGYFYAQVQYSITYVGDVYVEGDNPQFLEQLERDERINVVTRPDRAVAVITLLEDSIHVEMRDARFRNDVEDVIYRAYTNMRITWGTVSPGPNPVFIEIMNSLLIPLVLLLPVFFSMNILSDSIVREKERKTLEILFSVPMRREEIIIGKIIPVVILALAQVVAWIGLLSLIYPFLYHIPLVVLFLGMIMTFFFSSAVAFSTYAGTVRESNLFLILFMMAVTLLVFVPFPEGLSFMSRLSPVGGVVMLSSNQGLQIREILPYFLVYGVLSAVSFGMASRMLSKDEYTRLG
ncbi:MAG: ABC transporter permease [Theionarchaea archaeon]|nr:ABC transporter permease [Theionarchaea archaeon]MBU7022482.1 ABC transporter permease [Theionarchaea archaeon]MBU7036198.1 ABC transporter permease [Theionarchaea archaeon]